MTWTDTLTIVVMPISAMIGKFEFVVIAVVNQLRLLLYIFTVIKLGINS